jgi:hypothetical protein
MWHGVGLEQDDVTVLYSWRESEPRTTVCEEGQQANAEDNGCEECVAGKFSDTTGIAACTESCTAGSYSTVVGSASSADCQQVRG